MTLETGKLLLRDFSMTYPLTLQPVFWPVHHRHPFCYRCHPRLTILTRTNRCYKTCGMLGSWTFTASRNCWGTGKIFPPLEIFVGPEYPWVGWSGVIVKVLVCLYRSFDSISLCLRRREAPFASIGVGPLQLWQSVDLWLQSEHSWNLSSCLVSSYHYHRHRQPLMATSSSEDMTWCKQLLLLHHKYWRQWLVTGVVGVYETLFRLDGWLTMSCPK